MTANVEKRISELLDPLYEMGTTGSSEGWKSVLRETSNMFSSGPAALAMYTPATNTFVVIAGTYSDKGHADYSDRFSHIGLFDSATTRMRPGLIFWRKRDRPDGEFMRSEIFRNFLKREGVYDLVYFVLLDHKGSTYGITFSRPGAKTAFSDDDIKYMEMLMPHLRRALRVYLCAQELRDENARFIETLSRMPRSILFLDALARIVYSNDTALRILTLKDGLEMDRKGILFASLSKEERQLKALLASVLDAESDSTTGRGAVMPVSRPSGLRPLQVLISPFQSGSKTGADAVPLALMFVFDPEMETETSKTILCLMYDLTPAEARVAALISEGRSLKEAGKLLCIKQDTVRTHLKRIFAKTHCNRQTDLATLIQNSPAVLRNS